MWGLVSELQIWQTQATGSNQQIKHPRVLRVCFSHQTAQEKQHPLGRLRGKCLLVDEVEARMDRVGCLLFCHHQAPKQGGNVSFPPRAP